LRKLLHAAAVPVVVGFGILIIEGHFVTELFGAAWPVMGILGLSYVGGWGVAASLEQYPSIGQTEAAVLSAGCTLVPAGLFLGVLSPSPLREVALAATGGSAALYLADQFLHQFRTSRLVVCPGGVAYRLLAVSSVTPLDDEDIEADEMDGVVADLHTSWSAVQQFVSDRHLTEVPTYHAGGLYERLTARVLLGEECKTDLDVERPRYYPAFKRALDLALVAFSLPFTGSLFALCALGLWWEDGSPVLIWTARRGRTGTPFQMAEFRIGEASSGETHSESTTRRNERGGTMSRLISQVGLHRVPQLWNVVKGEMSLIGPRPLQAGSESVFDDPKIHDARHRVRPGMTGWAQVSRGFAVDETRRELEHDLYYVKHQSVALDVLIVYRTLKSLLMGAPTD
jgi:lipopolysaccharide/colanic/teichoic acid biosynthesis glycosyltransferase